MIRRLLNLLMASLLLMAGPAAAWAALVPGAPSCCEGPECPCPPAPRPAPQGPVTPTPSAVSPQIQTQSQAKRVPRPPEPSPISMVWRAKGESSKTDFSPWDAPDPPGGRRRQSLLGVFRN